MNYEKIGEFIASKRKEKDLTQNELARKVGVTDKAVSKWERGLGCPDVSILEVLAKELDVSVLELLKGRKIENEVINVTEADDYIKTSIIESKNYFKTKIKYILSVIIMIVVILLSGVIVFGNVRNYRALTDKSYVDGSFFENYSKIIMKSLNRIDYNIKELEKIKDKIDPSDYKQLIFSLKRYYRTLSKLKITNQIVDSLTYNDMFMIYIEDDALSVNDSINLYNIMEKYFTINKTQYSLLDDMLMLMIRANNDFIYDYNLLMKSSTNFSYNYNDVKIHYMYSLITYTRQTQYVDYILDEFIKEVRTHE